MNDLVMYLRAILRQEKYDSINYKIAQYLINHFDDIEHLSTSLLAENCHVSKSSISRFCKAIGVEDFSELKVLTRTKVIGANQKFYFPRYSQDSIDDFLTSAQNNITWLKEHLDKHQLNTLVDDIHKYQHIYIMGISQSLNPAYSLQEDLSYLHKEVYCVGAISDQRDILAHAKSDTLIIAFSLSGTFFNRIVPRERIMDREDAPCVYMVSCRPATKPQYMKDVIALNENAGYSTQSLLILFVNLLVVHYREKYCFNN